MTKITELFPMPTAPAATVKHNNARNRLLCRVMILGKKDFYLTSRITLILIDVHFTHGSICTGYLLGIKAERQQDQENQSWHDMFLIIIKLHIARRNPRLDGYFSLVVYTYRHIPSPVLRGYSFFGFPHS